MGTSRKDIVHRAKLAEHDERYDEMAAEIKTVAEMDGDFSQEERRLFWVAYKESIEARRTFWNIIRSMVEKERARPPSRRKTMLFSSLDKVKEEIIKICGDVIQAIDKHLVAKAQTPEPQVFFQTMKGDYYRCMAEVMSGDARVICASKSAQAYRAGAEISKELEATHPTRLALALNFSHFHMLIMNNTDEAYVTVRLALDGAERDLHKLKEEHHHETMFIMQLLRYNLNACMPRNKKQFPET